MAFSNHYRDLCLNILRGVAVSLPETVELALFTGTAGAGTEVTGGSYARQEVTFAAPATDGGERVIASSATVTFPKATAAWGTVTYAQLMDDSTIYVMLELETPKAVDTDDTLYLDAGDIEVALAPAD